jgi:hypothetical protein
MREAPAPSEQDLYSGDPGEGRRAVSECLELNSTREAPSAQRSRGEPVRDTTLRQVRERLRQAETMVSDGLAEVDVLQGLHAEMLAGRALSVKALPLSERARHDVAIRLASGPAGGVEMW